MWNLREAHSVVKGSCNLHPLVIANEAAYILCQGIWDDIHEAPLPAEQTSLSLSLVAGSAVKSFMQSSGSPRLQVKGLQDPSSRPLFKTLQYRVFHLAGVVWQLDRIPNTP